MLLQLHGYPVAVNGDEVAAHTPEHYEFVFRLMRWMLLNESDWTMVMDSPLNSEDRSEWAQWRRYLRDLGESLPDEFPEAYEIQDPPIRYRPESWVNLTPAIRNSLPNEHTHDDGITHTH